MNQSDQVMSVQEESEFREAYRKWLQEDPSRAAVLKALYEDALKAESSSPIEREEQAKGTKE